MRPALRLVRASEPPAIGDGVLVGRMLAGDLEAEDLLYRRHARPTAGMVARLLGSRDEVEDVVHDAFVSAFSKIEQLRDPSAFRAWLSMIAVTHVRRVL